MNQGQTRAQLVSSGCRGLPAHAAAPTAQGSVCSTASRCLRGKMSEARDTLWLVFTPACAAGNAAILRGQRAGVCVSAAIRSARVAAAMGSEIGSSGLPINAPEGSADLDESRACGRGTRKARDRLDIGPRGCERRKTLMAPMDDTTMVCVAFGCG